MVPTPTLMPTLSATSWCPRSPQRTRPAPPHSVRAHLNARAQCHLMEPTPASTPTPSATSRCPRPPQRPRPALTHGAHAHLNAHAQRHLMVPMPASAHVACPFSIHAIGLLQRPLPVSSSCFWDHQTHVKVKTPQATITACIFK